MASIKCFSEMGLTSARCLQSICAPDKRDESSCWQRVSPRFSHTRYGSLFSVVNLTRRIALRCDAGFGSTDFSLCAVLYSRKSKPHRLKPVLLDRAAPALWLHAIGLAFSLAQIVLASILLFSDDLQMWVEEKASWGGGNLEGENNEAKHNRGVHPVGKHRIYFPVCPEDSGAGHGTRRGRLGRNEAVRGGTCSADRALDRAQACNAV